LVSLIGSAALAAVDLVSGRNDCPILEEPAKRHGLLATCSSFTCGYLAASHPPCP